jgi:hypothetical protein
VHKQPTELSYLHLHEDDLVHLAECSSHRSLELEVEDGVTAVREVPRQCLQLLHERVEGHLGVVLVIIARGADLKLGVLPMIMITLTNLIIGACRFDHHLLVGDLENDVAEGHFGELVERLLALRVHLKVSSDQPKVLSM